MSCPAATSCCPPPRGPRAACSGTSTPTSTALPRHLVYIESAREHAAQHGLEVWPLPQGNRAKLQTYAQARALFAEGRLDVSEHDRELLRQLGEVTSAATAGGSMTIASPRRRGSHGDLASAFVAAAWYAKEQRRFYAEDDESGVGRVMVFDQFGRSDLTVDDDEADEDVEQPPLSYRLVRDADGFLHVEDL